MSSRSARYSGAGRETYLFGYTPAPYQPNEVRFGAGQGPCQTPSYKFATCHPKPRHLAGRRTTDSIY